ncbi:unnamed protein product [Diamesa tonsa]
MGSGQVQQHQQQQIHQQQQQHSQLPQNSSQGHGMQQQPNAQQQQQHPHMVNRNVQAQQQQQKNLYNPNPQQQQLSQAPVLTVLQTAQGAPKIGLPNLSNQQIPLQSLPYQQQTPASLVQQHSGIPQSHLQKLQTTLPQLSVHQKPSTPMQQQQLKAGNNFGTLPPSQQHQQQQQMQYQTSPPPPKPMHQHPQMKTTIKLGGPGQLPTVQKSSTPSSTFSGPSSQTLFTQQSSPPPPTPQQQQLNKSVPSTPPSLVMAPSLIVNQTSPAATTQQPSPTVSKPTTPNASPSPKPQAVQMTLTPTTVVPTPVSSIKSSLSPVATSLVTNVKTTAATTTISNDTKSPIAAELKQLTSPPAMPSKTVPKPIVNADEKKPVPMAVPAVESNNKTEKAPIVTPPVVVTKTVVPVKSTMRLATVTPKRQKAPTATKKTKATATPATPAGNSTTTTPKSKRVRTKTQPYQSPLPELALITKLSTQLTNPSASKNGDDKLTIFYKHEFLAVRNGEGAFYLCQTMHNVYKSSPKIRIRWLSEVEKVKPETSRVYKLDFYDVTDFECVLTTVDLEKMDKSFGLPLSELQRIENILKKAIDVEKGVVPRPTVTEENPDGLDLSLYKDESQLDKASPRKRKRGTVKSEAGDDEESESDEEETEDEEPLKKKNNATPTRAAASKKPVQKKLMDTESTGKIAGEKKQNLVVPVVKKVTPAKVKAAAASVPTTPSPSKVVPESPLKKGQVVAKEKIAPAIASTSTATPPTRATRSKK